ncbi:ferrochelatase [Lyticum sinuosum]|uniref:Ferrochelatase n=1 Tax=Lyticum sinuosum TaxID=1332059 RepID=A0AAE4VKP9_9RICK|nr:ferrochelatase [Lyticum sinuosum]MDZ5761039.1 Ferrochelatase [Lyticum sinuosum]
MSINKKIAVILCNLGGPSSLKEVNKFLFNLFYDPAILNLRNPLRWIIAKIISKLRTKKAKLIYQKINGKSPILEETSAQAISLEVMLNRVDNEKTFETHDDELNDKLDENNKNNNKLDENNKKIKLEKKLYSEIYNDYFKIYNINQEKKKKLSPFLQKQDPQIDKDKNVFLNRINKQKENNKKEDYKNHYKVFIAMRYTKPSAKDVIYNLLEYNPDEIIILPLYPQFSNSTSGSSIKELISLINKNFHKKISVKTIECHFWHHLFIKSHVKILYSILIEVVNSDKLCKSKSLPLILFSAHGLPQKMIDSGDPYENQMKMCIELIMKELHKKCREGGYNKNLNYKLCYQSKVGASFVKWLGPNTEDEIVQASKEKQGIIIVPISFVSEHSETLVELDIDYAQIAEDNQIPYYIRAKTLSIEPNYINCLIDLVKNSF